MSEDAQGGGSEAPQERKVNVLRKWQTATTLKAFMMINSEESNTNIYDHLTRLLVKVMEERPRNAVDVFEDMSREVKRAAFDHRQSTLREQRQPKATERLAEQQRLLFSRTEDVEQHDEQAESVLPNVGELSWYLEQAGVGLGREEMHRIFLALKLLVESRMLQRVRLWGKILGLERNYIIAESEYREGEEEEEPEPEDIMESILNDNFDVEKNEDSESLPIPRSTYKPPPTVPKEALGSGTNRCVYYVCSMPGLSWEKLPSVSPAHIIAARQIRKFFTGRLDAPIVSYPPFPGNEANYLRAQIARISASTHVSPQGFYYIGEEEGDEDEEDEASRDSYEVNPDFEGIPATEMAESLSKWVHHSQYILEQGRCRWVNLAMKPGDESNEEDDEDKDEEPDEAEPQVGPPLLTPLSRDSELFNIPPWSCRLSSARVPQHSVAGLGSNVWPGACAYACGRKFENMYVGWGMKYAGDGYSPPVPPLPQWEYPTGADITEALDPTVEEEQEVKDALEEQQAVQEELQDTDDEEDEDDE